VETGKRHLTESKITTQEYLYNDKLGKQGKKGKKDSLGRQNAVKDRRLMAAVG